MAVALKDDNRPRPASNGMHVYIAADHAGFALKNELLKFVTGLGHDAEDCGALVNDPADDYPEIIAGAARKLSQDAQAGRGSRAIMIGASGQGEAMVANRFKGVRCALYYGSAGKQKDMIGKELDIISSTREHNNANALSLGARFISTDEAKQVVKIWLEIGFSGEERHVRRIGEIEKLGTRH